jgi:5,10-methylenetetrahydromethanopterin reductase
LAITKNVSIALMAMSPYTVHPVYATMAAATLNEQFPGRVILCFGAGAPRDLEAVGIKAEHPLATIIDSIAIARSLLNGEATDLRGDRYNIHGRRLTVGAQTVPIYLAASGPQMLELAGSAADGVLISAATSPAFIRWTLELVKKGEQRANRTIKKTALVYTSVDDSHTSAHDRLRRTLGFILRGQHHARNLEMAGTSLEQSLLAKAYASEDWATVESLVTDEVVVRHSASGTPQEVRNALHGYEAVGLDEIVGAGMKDVDQLHTVLRALE